MADSEGSAGDTGNRPRNPTALRAGRRAGRKRRRKQAFAKGGAKAAGVRIAGEGAPEARGAHAEPSAARVAVAPAPASPVVALPADATRPMADMPRTGAPPRQAFAAIDLGTNNCRLLIARPAGDHFVVIDAFSRVVRLGEGLAQTGRLSDAAMDRALAALGVCAEKLCRRNVLLARSVATEACRRASNGAEFIARVHRETGIRLDVITAQEEARLAVLGCQLLLEHGSGPAMIFDIGGGSTEMVLVDTHDPVPRILDWQSVPWGVVSLTESIGAIADCAEARAAAYARMRALVHQGFAAFAARVAGEHATLAESGCGAIRLLGTSGTVTTLASLHLGLPQYDRSAVDGVIVPAASMRAISQRLAHATPAERVAVPCIGRERSDLVVAGCAILETILDIWPAERLGIADRGIREGILRSLMATASDAEKARIASRRRDGRAA